MPERAVVARAVTPDEVRERSLIPLPVSDAGTVEDPLLVVDLSGPGDLPENLGMRSQVVIGVLPADPPDSVVAKARHCTVTLSSSPLDVRTIVHVSSVEDAVSTLEKRVCDQASAATALHQLLWLQSGLSVDAALVAESAIYSMLLAAPSFLRWREGRPVRCSGSEESPVRLEADTPGLRITLTRPNRGNAYNRSMRDALVDALTITALRPEQIVLAGDGPDFCTGGDLDEFGTTPDIATAHIIRLARNAGWLLHGQSHRCTALLHGRCVGAGIEIPAFAGRVLANEGTRIALPELRMGLIPGAGGTVSIARRIGRWRTAWLTFTETELDAEGARSWGLVDEVVR